MQVLGPINGGWWCHHHWTRLSYHKWHCSNLFFWKGKGQIPFFKANHPSTEKPRALVGFELRTEPELRTGDSHSTSTPPRTLNPLTTEFFPPRQHIFRHSAHTTFVGTPLPQHSLLSGQTWWGPHTWRDPSGNTVNDIHDPPQAQQSEVKGGCQPDFRPAFP